MTRRLETAAAPPRLPRIAVVTGQRRDARSTFAARNERGAKSARPLPRLLSPAYARAVGDPRAVINRLTAAQNAHDLEGMLACFHEDYHSEQPLFPARAFQGIDQVRTNWSALLENIPDFHGETLRSAVDGGTVFAEIHWTGTKADGARLDERGVIIAGTRDERIAWGRLYVDEVEPESADIDAVVRRMGGTDDP
jgi:ketosteroid isomerase-like protein